MNTGTDGGSMVKSSIDLQKQLPKNMTSQPSIVDVNKLQSATRNKAPNMQISVECNEVSLTPAPEAQTKETNNFVEVQKPSN